MGAPSPCKPLLPVTRLENSICPPYYPRHETHPLGLYLSHLELPAMAHIIEPISRCGKPLRNCGLVCTEHAYEANPQNTAHPNAPLCKTAAEAAVLHAIKFCSAPDSLRR